MATAAAHPPRFSPGLSVRRGVGSRRKAAADGHAGRGRLRCTLDDGGTSGEMTVTEAEWLACDDSQPMLDYLRGKASERKLRLFLAACCRHLWIVTTGEDRAEVGVAEMFADWKADKRLLATAAEALRRVLGHGHEQLPRIAPPP